MTRQLCPTHPDVNYKREWGCPTCLRGLRNLVREYLTEMDNHVAPDLTYRRVLRERLREFVGESA